MRGMGKILGGAGSLPRDCWISDISDGGVWRLGHEAGVAFSDSFMPGFGQRTAGR